MQLLEKIIDQGVILDPNFQQKFTYRNFLYMPVGAGFVYLVDKKPEVVEREMEILSKGEMPAMYQYAETGVIYPIFWDEGMPEIPVGFFNIYELITSKNWKLISVLPEYQPNHEALFKIYMQAING